MIIVGVNRSPHNASVALLKDGKILFHIEGERLSNVKYDKLPFQALSKIKEYVDHVDYLVLAGLAKTGRYDSYRTEDAYSAHLLGLNKTFIDHNMITIDLWDKHHQLHALSSFYSSGFDSALCIVKDGTGSEYYLNNNRYAKGANGRESGSSFIISYPGNAEVLEKHITVPFEVPNDKEYIEDNVYISNTISEGRAFEYVARKFGLTDFDAGKIMGMSAYGNKDQKFPNIYVNDLINRDLFPHARGVEDVLNLEIADDFQSQANFAYHLQSSIQEHVTKEILDLLDKTGQKNLCLSGGYFLNCLSNGYLLKHLPKDVNIYVEPMSNDSGTALGAAKFLDYMLSEKETVEKQTHIYYGLDYKYTVDDLKNESNVKHVSSLDVAQLISEKNIVAIYQGKSESGPRALGNRSILYDPRDPNGKEYVNRVKKREWYRPFAGTVLFEHAHDWFNLHGLEESPFMMFAVDVLKDKQEVIPAITHIDGTCRVQTLRKEVNPYYYELINNFYELTGVPILFNTSFNLAGNTIVETLQDALWTLHNSDIDYLYLPEMSVLVGK